MGALITTPFINRVENYAFIFGNTGVLISYLIMALRLGFQASRLSSIELVIRDYARHTGFAIMAPTIILILILVVISRFDDLRNIGNKLKSKESLADATRSRALSRGRPLEALLTQ
eukprot:TRINITY_DN22898_c0_g1_i1.p1 TRINITY_DN22898_c0_g1~~TRINITY_DN22898_c0_g1_i1.p1  ORF type:complete len:116 (-),score=11.90 TRINITY_DN22898_c0_g1_i1:111-458(-)